jgi:putative transcriptional regulator
MTPAAPILNHHPDDAILVDYAAGHLDEATGLLIATHLALCPLCRRNAAAFDALGGALLDTLPPLPVEEACLAAVLARLDEPASPEPPSSGLMSGPAPGAGVPVLPEPLRSYVGTELDGVRWKPLLRGLDQFVIAMAPGPSATRLLRLAGGGAIPRHTHLGTEMMLVLQGGFSDHRGHYRRGDVMVADATVDHRPIADRGDPCLCLAVTDSPLRLTGPVARWFNRLVMWP